MAEDLLTDLERESVERLRRDRRAASPTDLRVLVAEVLMIVDRVAPRPVRRG